MICITGAEPGLTLRKAREIRLLSGRPESVEEFYDDCIGDLGSRIELC